MLIGKVSVLAESNCNIGLMPGDSVSLTYTDEYGKEHEVVSAKIDKPMSFTRGIIFENKDMIGGAFIKK